MARRSRSHFIVAAFLGVTLFSIALVVILVVFVAPSGPGEPIASRDLTSGEDFELSYVSNGQPMRVFVDMECEACSLPVDGHVEVSAAGREVKKIEISAGSRDELASRNRLDDQLITEIPAQASGTQVAVRGRLSVLPERGLLSGRPDPEARPATVRTLRVTIAP